MKHKVPSISFRGLQLEDAKWLVEINDKEVNRFLLNSAISNRQLTVEDEKEWIKKKLNDKSCENIVILYNKKPAGIGEIKFKKNYAEIGLWIRKKFWGKGLCKELVKKLVEIGREKGYHRITLSVDEQNIAARKCYERVGFEYSGFEEKTIEYQDIWRNEFKMEYVFDFKIKQTRANNKVEIKELYDIDTAFEIHKNSNSVNFEFYTPSKQEIESLKGKMYFAFYNGEKVGFMSLIERTHEIEIEWLAVHKDYQSKGIGSALIRYAMSFAKKKNKEFLIVRTSSRNERALRFYRRLGFQKYGFIANAYSWGDTQIVLKIRVDK